MTKHPNQFPRGPIPPHSEVQFEPFRLTAKPPQKLNTFPSIDMSSYAMVTDLEGPMRKRLGIMRRHGVGRRPPKPKQQRRDYRGRWTKDQ
jgi:hypothetical protein